MNQYVVLFSKDNLKEHIGLAALIYKNQECLQWWPHFTLYLAGVAQAGRLSDYVAA